MKRTIIISFGLIVFLCLALAIIPSTRNEFHWYITSHKDKVPSWEKYVLSWPEGRHSVEAWARFDELIWSEAVNSNTAQGYERYINLYNNGKYIKQGRYLQQAIYIVDSIH